MIKHADEEQVISLARGARWGELTSYITKHIKTAPTQKGQPWDAERLLQRGISDDTKRRLITNWFVDMHR